MRSIRTSSAPGRPWKNTGAQRRKRPAVDSETGMVLPVVLYLVLALALLSTAVFWMSGAARVVGRQGIEALRASVRAEAVLPVPSDSVEGGERVRRREWAIGGGFTLVEARPDDRVVASFAVLWRLRPDSVARDLPGAAEVDGPASFEGIAWLPGCPSMGRRSLVRIRPSGGDGSREPGSGIRLGLLEVADLLALADTDLDGASVFPSSSEPGAFRAPAGAVISGGSARGLLVSQGSLTLRDSARFRGLVVVPGTLTLAGAARIEGIVLAGAVSEEGGASELLGCPEVAREALYLPALSGLHPVPGGRYLGRY